MFTTFIVQPIFNLLVLIYAILPGHNFGLAIIIFTIVVRLLLWPLMKKQLHQTKIMRKLQPELKRIKKEAKGDRQKESVMVMALYKEHGVNPFGSIGVLILQLPILIALYDGLRKVVANPHEIVTFAYPALQHLPWMQQLSHNIHQFDGTLFGVVDLTKSAVTNGLIYWPALIIVVASAVLQYFQSKQLLVTDKNARSLRTILREAGAGKEADQGEVSAAVGGMTRYFIPIMVLVVTIRLASALGLYWLVGGIVAYIQQTIILREDETELEAIADSKTTKEKDVKAIPEAEVVAAEPDAEKTPSKTKTSKKYQGKKRRKK
ncbi:MAG TPA: YidC/Oxa1 family membrane protein insertase [Candidatus Saccharimonadales bacterium]|nr:YidC/Oxa1 family membrane protein insertase [Candidatus Saccharimonadales bacterium]